MILATNSFTHSRGSESDCAVKHIVTQHTGAGMDNDTTDLILNLYTEEEISEYAARVLLDDETIDRYNEKIEQAGRRFGQHHTGDEMDEWPDDVPMPYGHIPKEEYYVEGHTRR